MKDKDNSFLRKVNSEDKDLLLEWANDETVRKNSFHTEHIAIEEHEKWFMEVMKSQTTYLYIYLYNDCPVGQIRINVNDDEGVVDYSISLAWRGMGHGKRMLLLAEQQLRTDAPQVKKLRAQVKKDNIASMLAFAGIGYQEQFCTLEKNLVDSENVEFDTQLRKGGGNLSDK